MDYEEKYKSALKWMQSLYGGLHGATKEEAEKYFPELKEPNDERIRKELIAIYSVGAKVNAKTGDIPDRDIVAWLEKQELRKIESNTLDAAKVIEWLKHRELSCDDVVTTVIPDDSPTSVRHKVKLLSDKFIEQFKKDFEI